MTSTHQRHFIDGFSRTGAVKADAYIYEDSASTGNEQCICNCVIITRVNGSMNQTEDLRQFATDNYPLGRRKWRVYDIKSIDCECFLLLYSEIVNI